MLSASKDEETRKPDVDWYILLDSRTLKCLGIKLVVLNIKQIWEKNYVQCEYCLYSRQLIQYSAKFHPFTVINITKAMDRCVGGRKGKTRGELQ